MRAFVDGGEAGTRIAAEGVDFVALLRTVEVEAVRLLVVEGVERDAVGPPAVANDGQDAAPDGAQHLADFVLGQRLPRAPHGADGAHARAFSAMRRPTARAAAKSSSQWAARQARWAAGSRPDIA